MSDSNNDTQTVVVGGKEYQIQRFRGLKAILVFAAVTRIGRDVPDLIADAAKEYSEKHTVRITEDMASLPRWSGFSKEDFDKAEEMTGKRVIELPDSPEPQAAILSALPTLLESTGRREVIRLFAILLIPNKELAEADRNDRVNEALDAYSEIILYDAELDELIDLALAAQSAVTQLNSGQKERLGKIVRSLMDRLGVKMPGTTETQTPSSPQTPQTTEDSTPSTLTDDAQISSIDSQSDTDGHGTLRSTEPLGLS